ncbi:MAG: molybdopterin oxidoreductase, partial [Candidatus Hydrogenedentes bacterium]|nr:molybdopterin oxidoreductase [Candidatus Hydrogenedentota bacterium]
RGGRFEDYGQAYTGDRLAHTFSGRLFFFSEALALAQDSMDGAFFDGLPKFEAPADLLGNPIETQDSAYPLQLVTYKYAWHTQMHTIRYPWLVSVLPENFVEMNSVDAAARGIASGDLVRVSSASSPEGVIGPALAVETVRPGVVAISHHFGHWQMSSRPHEIDGENSAFDPSRAAGISPNGIMRKDTVIGNVTLQDKIGGSASFYDTFVQVSKI